MTGLLQSIADRWRNTSSLCALMPDARVFTGRVPSTEEYRMPYVSVAQGESRSLYRSDKSQVYAVQVAFHIWADDADVATAEQIEGAIVAAFAEAGWSYDAGFGQGQIIDVLDHGPARKQQVNKPTFKAWQTIKAMTFIVERERVDTSAGDNESSAATSESAQG